MAGISRPDNKEMPAKAPVGVANGSPDASAFACPTVTFTAPSATLATQCANTTMNLSVSTTAKGPDAIKFVYFTTPLSNTADAYTTVGGTVLGTVNSGTATTNTVSLNNVQLPDNVGTTVQTLYVYALLQAADGVCKAADQFTITLTTKPTVTVSGNTQFCQGSTTDLTATGPAGATYQWFLNNATTAAATTWNVYTTPATSTTATYRVRAILNGCASDDASIVLTPFVCTACTASPTSLGGVVYRDVNSNGSQDGTDASLKDVTVTLFSCNASGASTQVAQIQTNASGAYSFNGLNATTTYRVEFSNFPPGYTPSFDGAGSGSTVQFTKPGICTVSLGLNLAGDYCQAVPLLITPCYVPGSISSGTTIDALVSYPYSFANIEKTLATKAQVGSVWGVAFNKLTKQLYTSAFLKRNVGIGPGGLGAIYVTNTTAATANATLLFDIATVDNVGSSQINMSEAARGLATLSPTSDSVASGLIGKVGLGDLDITDDGTYLYTVSLATKKLWRIPTTGPTTANATSWTIPNLPNWNLAKGDYRPFALKYANDKVYIGVTFDAGISQLKADLAASVYEFDPATGVFTVVHTFPMSYVHGPANTDYLQDTGGFFPWLNNPTTPWYPQPVFSDIELDIDGTMTLGFFDRNGHQTSGSQVGGEILRLGRNPANLAQYQLESGGRYYNKTGGNGFGAANNEGPGGGEFYVGDNYLNHHETSLGGLAIKPGSNEVILTAEDPLNYSYSGYIALSQSNGTQTRSGINITSLFGKANGLGDVELTCDPTPIQIGNRVWRDDNNNGIQDPCEPAISGAVVKLYDAAKTTVLASVTTNAAGEYNFSSVALAGTTTSAVATTALTYNTTYNLVITSLGTSTAVAGISLTNVSPVTPGESGPTNSGTSTVNNDAKLDAGLPTIVLTTGGPAENNHTYDFGITVPPCVKPTLATIASQSVCQGTAFSLPLVSSVLSNTVTSLQWYLTNAAGTSFTAISGATNLTLTSAQAVPPTAGNQKFYALVGQNGLSALCSDTVFVSLYMKPTQTIAFTTPAVTQCANTTLNLSVTTNAKAPDAIQFIYFTSPLASAADAYTATGGTVLGSVNSGTATTNTVTLSNVQFPDYLGSLNKSIYVYALLRAADGVCQIAALQTVTLKPRPYIAIGVTSTSICQATSATLTAVGPATTTYQWYLNSGTAVVGTTSSLTSIAINGPTTYRLKGTLAGCVSDEATISLSPVVCTPCTASPTSIGGTVYRDFGSDGSDGATDPGMSNVTVTIFKCDASSNSTQVATMQTDINGQYSFTGLTAGITYRVEFSNLPAGYDPTYRGTQNGTTVQFTQPGSCSISLGINQPADYCQASAPLFTPCYTPGTLASVASTDALVQFDYTFTNMKHLATTGQIGSTWGVAYNKQTKLIYSTAFLKRYVAMGPSGMGAIYVTNPNASSANASLFFDLATVDNVGSTSISISDAARGITSNQGGNNDTQASALIGKVSLGDLDISDDQQYLYTISLASKKLWQIPTTSPTAANVKSWAIPNLPNWNLTKGDYRPFAVKYYQGKVYVGLTFDAEKSQQKADLAAAVLALDLQTNTFSEVLTFPVNYNHGDANNAVPDGGFYPWVAVSSNAMYPQPVLSDLDFDLDGTMTLAFFDRNGHMIGGQIGGEILRAGRNPQDLSQYQLEINGILFDQTGKMLQSSGGVGNSEGPNGGEFYVGDAFVNHRETSLGGVAIKPGSGEIVITSMDPNNYGWGGFVALSQINGTKARALDITSAFGKANGLGDVDIICDQPAPIQIGNRVWRDDNQNGIQDPCEPPIPGAVVKLYDATKTTVIASATTNAAGEYYFSSATVVAGTSTSSVATTALQYNTTYGLVITSLGTSTVVSSQGLTLTDVSPVTPGESGATNSGITQANNDAKLNAGQPTILLTTGGAGESNHTYDFGIAKFVCSLTATVSASSPTVCTGRPVTLTAQVSPASSYTYAWSAPVGVTLTGATTATATATASVAGLQTFTMTVSSSPSCFTTATVSVSVSVCQVLPASLGDKVFVDTNSNGIQDAGDTPLPNVTVSLLSSGTSIATTKTDASGLYSFTGLTPGIPYSVSFTTPVGYTATTYPTGITPPVTLTAGENNLTLDAGMVPLKASLGNYVWLDTNGNGQQDPTESGVASVTAVLCDAISGTVVSTSVTDAMGRYLFSNLNPGSYIVKFTTPSGTTFTSANTGADDTDSDVASTTGNAGSTGVYSVSAGQQVLNVAAGIKLLTATLGDSVFEDVNANGQQDAGDKPLPGVNVRLLASGTLVATTTSDASGFYSFMGLTPGVPYALSFTTPAGYTATSQNTGPDATDSDGNPATGLTGTYSLTANEFNNTVDMGFVVQTVCSLSVTAGPSSTLICANSSATLTVGCQTGTPLWSTGASTSLITVTPTSTTTYSVVCQSGSCVSPPATATVTVMPQPSVGANQTLVCTNGVMPSTATLTAQTNSSVPTGQWYAQPGNPSATTFTNATSLTTIVSGLLPGQTYRFVWANTSGCANGMIVTVGTCGPLPATYQLAKTVDKSREVIGGIVTYTVSLTNTGNSTGTNVVVSDQFSTTAVTFIGSATASTGTFTPAGNSGSWVIASLAPGQVATLALRVQLNAEGITYNTATAPNGQTATVCTSVPYRVCANETFQFNLAVAPGFAPYQWSKDGQPIAGATTNTLSVTALGEYAVASSTTGTCPDGSCCPFIIEANPVPSLSAIATAASCNGGTPLNDAKITLVGSSTSAVSYNISLGNSFTASAPLFATNQALASVVGGVLRAGLANPVAAPGQAYTIRVYAADGCFADTVVTIPPALCNCPASVCVPVTVKRIR